MGNYETINAGTQYAVWEQESGACEIVSGPRRIPRANRRIEPLEIYTASQHEYLEIQYKDGHKENKPGPIQVFMNPLIHKKIELKEAVSLTSHEVLVVYRRTKNTDNDSEVTRNIIHGPQMYVPSSDEWIHEFVWHGSDPRDKTKKIPDGSRFTKLKVIPSQFYYNVGEVRTCDDTLLTCKIMLFYEISKIEVMLNTTHDPIADFINAICADIVSFVSKMTYEEFLENTAKLNELETYPQLVQGAQRIGYSISKVVYRGYRASDKLQQMHDSAIESRTSLRLEAENEEQAQRLADLKLQKELERSKKRQEMLEAEKNHEIKMEKLAQTARLQQKKHEEEMELTFKKQDNENQLKYFAQMKGIGVDLTKYLVAQYQNPDKVIKIDSGASMDGASRTNLHFHEK